MNAATSARGGWVAFGVTSLALSMCVPVVPVFAQECYTPKEWQPKLGSRWNRDANNNNIEDDLEDLDPGDRVDVILDLNDCPRSGDINRLTSFGILGYVGRFISIVELKDVQVADLPALAADVNVAMVEQDREYDYGLDISNPTVRVRASPEYSPMTVEDQFGLDGAGVNIAVIDSGVDDGLHESLPAWKFIGGYDTLLGMETNPDDTDGHGTHVAGIALGTGGASGRNRGIAPGAGLIDISFVRGSNDSLLAAIEKCIEQRVEWNIRVANISIADPFCAPTNGRDAASQLVNRAVREGIVVVGIIGNNGIRCGLPEGAAAVNAPGAADDMITVAASSMGIPSGGVTVDRSDDRPADFSLSGPRDADFDLDTLDELKPDVAAPGVGFYPTNEEEGDGINSAGADTVNGYVLIAGTSQAAPHVAGLAALILQASPDMRPLSVKRLILETADEDFHDDGWDGRSGYGLVDGFAAIDALMSTPKSDLRFDEYCESGPDWWLSASIVPQNPVIEVGVPNTVIATIVNGGPEPVSDALFHLGVYNLSNSDADYGICTVDLMERHGAPLAPMESLTIECPWVPAASGDGEGVIHACLKAEIIYPFDSDFANNCAQHNVMIQQTASPAAFHATVVNPTGRNMFMRMAHDLPAGLGWTIDLGIADFTMTAFECPRPVEITLTPNPGATGWAHANVSVFGRLSPNYPEEPLGGFTVVAHTPAVPGDIDGNGRIDVIDFGLFHPCLTGPGVIVRHPGCFGANIRPDIHIDLLDFALFQNNYAAPANDHDCCAVGYPGCVDPAIESCVCARDPYCCHTQWDSICVSEVATFQCGSCTHDCCETGLPGCADLSVQYCVCAQDPHCCYIAWDQTCVDEVDELQCGSCTHDCCETGPPGCADPYVQYCVCMQDPHCCDTAWDQTCVNEVNELQCGSCGP